MKRRKSHKSSRFHGLLVISSGYKVISISCDAAGGDLWLQQIIVLQKQPCNTFKLRIRSCWKVYQSLIGTVFTGTKGGTELDV